MNKTDHKKKSKSCPHGAYLLALGDGCKQEKVLGVSGGGQGEGESQKEALSHGSQAFGSSSGNLW